MSLPIRRWPLRFLLLACLGLGGSHASGRRTQVVTDVDPADYLGRSLVVREEPRAP